MLAGLRTVRSKLQLVLRPVAAGGGKRGTEKCVKSCFEESGWTMASGCLVETLFVLFLKMEKIVMNIDFNRKVRTMLSYSGLSLNVLAKTMSISRQTLANRMNLELNSEMQNKILNALYFAAGPAMAEDLKELETTLDYLEEQHG